jgi:hypothetical protein
MASIRTHFHMKVSNISLRCMQINLLHSKIATDNFNQLMMDTAIDMASTHEPHTQHNQVIGIS